MRASAAEQLAILPSLGAPEIAFLCAAGAGGLLLLLLLWLGRRRRRAAAQQLESYKEQVVAYSSAMDKIQERHKMLPFTDEDFSAPMVGETLAAYQEVEQALQRHRDQWLQLMDVWDRAEKLLDDKDAAAVLQLTAGADVKSRAAQLQQQCQAELDRLERAHERVDQLLADQQQARQAIQTQMQQLAEQGLAAQWCEQSLAEAAAQTDAAKQLHASDPLGAELELSQSSALLTDVGERAAAVLLQRQRAAELDARQQQTTDLAAMRRAEGLKMNEPRGNPDSLLNEAADFHRLAIDCLQRAAPEEARPHLDRADHLLQEAAAAIEFQTRFRDEGPRRIAELGDQARVLLADAEEAGRRRDQLAERHAEAAWRLVESNAEQAAELAESLERLLHEAAAAADPERQDYYRARDLVDEAEDQLPDAQRLAAAVGQRLAELDALAKRAEQRLADVEQQRRRIQGQLQSSTADRERSNLRHQQAAAALDNVLQDARQARPDWPHIDRQLDHIEKDLRAVEEMVREDLRLADQAAAEIREATQEVRRCQGFYQMGVSANVGSAEGEIRSAQRALDMQQYEQAVALANSAEQLAREALESARREAERREQEAQSRRNRETAMQVASVVATVAAQAAMHMSSGRRRRR